MLLRPGAGFCGAWLRASLPARLAHSAIGKNVVSLYLLYFGNYLLPIITVPYLLRVLGPKHFGMVAFGQGLIAFLGLFVNFAFDLSATRTISVNRDNHKAVCRTAASVWVAKSGLCLIAFLGLGILVAWVQRFREVGLLLFVLYGTVVGNVLFPTWLYQGMESMAALPVITVGARAFAAVAIFGLVHQPSHFLTYATILASQSIIGGAAAAIFGCRRFEVRFELPAAGDVYRALRESCTVFLTTVSTSFYTIGNTVILGLLTDHVVVGYFSAAERMVKALQAMVGPLCQATYPRLSKLAVDSTDSALLWGGRMLAAIGALGLVMSGALFFGAPTIVLLVLGPAYAASILVMRILSVLPFIISCSNVLGIQLMIPFRREGVMLALVFGAGCINVVLALCLAPTWGAAGMAFAVVATELFVAVGMFSYLSMTGLRPVLHPRRLLSESSHQA